MTRGDKKTTGNQKVARLKIRFSPFSLTSNEKTNVVIVLIFTVAVIAFGFFFNSSLQIAVNEKTRSDKEFLSRVNETIIEELQNSDEEEWQNVIEGFNQVSITVYDNANTIICSTFDSKAERMLGSRQRTAFIYKSKAYLVMSKVYLFSQPTQEAKLSAVRYLAAAILNFSLIILVLMAIIYFFSVKPFRDFYQSIEEYDRTGEFSNKNIKGYIGRVYKRFVRMTNNLSKSRDNQQQIISSISHDIKTPLTSIMGYSEILSNSEVSLERRKKYLGIIYSKSQQIKTIVDDFDEFLDYKLQSSVQFEKISADYLRSALLREYASDLEMSGIDFNVYVKRGKSMILVDESKLFRVFSNLISNSVKHMKKPDKKITVEIYSKRDTFFIRFSDNGEGVEPGTEEMIFEPLYTSDKGRKVAGLGLSICREIIEKHGGKIYSENHPSEGLDIIIELPLES